MTPQSAAHLLTSTSHRRRGPPPVRVMGEFALEPGRAHELCGPARRRLALAVAGAIAGPVIWVRPAWSHLRVNPDGMIRLLDPGRLIFVEAAREADLLWSMEEVLRSGAVALVVADLPVPPGLTPVRRLHLAAERGVEAGGAPLGLLLTPGEGGAAGAESRWSLTPRHQAGEVEAWRLARLRARRKPPAGFDVRMGETGMEMAPPETEPA